MVEVITGSVPGKDGADEPALGEKVALLTATLESIGRVVVAFSGGADSACLAWFSRSVLGRGAAVCVTGVSPSLAPGELEECRRLAAEWDLDWYPVDTTEMDDVSYVANDASRCFHCKSALMEALEPLADKYHGTIVLGVNCDDLGDHRPGQQAASSRGARFPLVEAGFTKADVRAASRLVGLRTSDKPAAACLSSRLPYGTRVSVDVLLRVGRAESALRKLGFKQVRVRHYGDTARIELPVDELARATDLREEVVAGVRDAGYRYVTLDLEGFRSGNLNGGQQ